MSQKQVSFRLEPKLEAFILRKETESLHLACRDNLDAFRMLYESEYRKLTGLLTEDEAMAIVDSFNGTIIDDVFVSNLPETLFWQVSETIKYEYINQKWEMREDFLEKLRSLAPLAAFILVEKAKEWWASPEPDRELARKLFRC